MFVLIISPLESIIDDQLSEMPSLNFTALELSLETTAFVKDNPPQFLYCSAKKAIKKFFLEILQEGNINLHQAVSNHIIFYVSIHHINIIIIQLLVPLLIVLGAKKEKRNVFQVLICDIHIQKYLPCTYVLYFMTKQSLKLIKAYFYRNSCTGSNWNS